ncbi:glycosyltransferase family protein [Azospirillum agricola]|uniref:glycosyltransferase family 9 protein n=1 Tax=Azospirillum agricola TaxID=1720247 RepID=UPI0011777495|nr:glycosyltransferase family 9 protein [Azospirillum agricola]
MNDLIGKLNSAISGENHYDVFQYSLMIHKIFGENIPENIKIGIAGALHNAAYHFMHNAFLPDLAVTSADMAWALTPNSNTYNQLVLAHLFAGDYDRAWSIRHRVADTPKPWTPGSPPLRLGIFNSNGMGDLFQFLRFIEKAKPYAAEIHLSVPRRLSSLIRQCTILKGIQVVEDFSGIHIDAIHDLLYLPILLGLKTADIEPLGEYIPMDAQRSREWRSVVRRTDAPHVGIVWSALDKNDKRSVGLAAMSGLFDVPGAVFIGLQGNTAKSEMFDVPMPGNFADFGVYDIENTAAIISTLDLVITPDCGVAHLSCAMGKETFILLRQHCDWRWIEAGNQSRWYSAATLFRQEREGDWAPVITAVRTALLSRIKHGFSALAEG